jgi:hypothetical protein
MLVGCWSRRGLQGRGPVPHTICRADSEAGDAWRWKSGDVVYRCADGEVHYSGAPNLEPLVCNAMLP